MKNLTTGLLISILFFSCKKDVDVQVNANNVSSAIGANKRIYFTNAGNWVDQNFAYLPGDTFVLKANINYTYFSMSNVHDVVFINEGGVVKMQNGFNFNNCQNIRVTGTGSSEFYGFEIAGHTSGDVGIDINGKSAVLPATMFTYMIKPMGFG